MQQQTPGPDLFNSLVQLAAVSKQQSQKNVLGRAVPWAVGSAHLILFAVLVVAVLGLLGLVVLQAQGAGAGSNTQIL
jgi:hypothetical protein